MSLIDMRLVSKNYSPLIEDIRPDNLMIGQKVIWNNDGREFLGKIIGIDNRKITLKLEKRWMHRTKITVNWRFLRLVNDNSDIHQSKDVQNQERIKTLRNVVEKTTNWKWSPEKKLTDQEIDQLINECKKTYEILQLYFEEFETAKEKVHILIRKLTDEQDICVKHGIPETKLPPRYQQPENPVIVHRGRRRKNVEHRKKLQEVRNETRSLLVALLHAAGNEGVSSDEVIAALCGMNPGQDDTLPITQHRIMGMLSAFSRRKEAELTEYGKWRATLSLQVGEHSGMIANEQDSKESE